VLKFGAFQIINKEFIRNNHDGANSKVLEPASAEAIIRSDKFGVQK